MVEVNPSRRFESGVYKDPFNRRADYCDGVVCNFAIRKHFTERREFVNVRLTQLLKPPDVLP